MIPGHGEKCRRRNPLGLGATQTSGASGPRSEYYISELEGPGAVPQPGYGRRAGCYGGPTEAQGQEVEVEDGDGAWPRERKISNLWRKKKTTRLENGGGREREREKKNYLKLRPYLRCLFSPMSIQALFF